MNTYRDLYKIGDYTACERECRKVVEASPADFDAAFTLCLSLRRQGREEEAHSFASLFLSSNSLDSEQQAFFYHLMGDAQRTLGNLENAIVHYTMSVELEPNRLSGLYVLAQAYFTNNNFVRCLEMLDRIFESGSTLPDEIYADSLYLLAQISRDISPQRFFEQYPDVKRELPNSFNFNFALGRLYENGHDVTSALQHYDVGNQLKRASTPYSFQSEQVVFQKHRESVLNGQFDFQHSLPELPFVPIFIVGMPRSGSSLLEQMLGAHSEVTPFGESRRLMDALMTTLGPITDDSKAVELGMQWIQDAGFCEKLRQNYLDSFGAVNTDFVVDKSLGNFQLLWLLKTAFPECPVLFTDREKGPTVWSCYKTNFERAARFSESMEEISVYYDSVQGLRDLWAEKFGPVLLNVVYENLIADPRKLIEEILVQLGLDFEEACLNPSGQARIVETASKVQVTQPIYKIANRDWLPFAELVKSRLGNL